MNPQKPAGRDRTHDHPQDAPSAHPSPPDAPQARPAPFPAIMEALTRARFRSMGPGQGRRPPSIHAIRAALAFRLHEFTYEDWRDFPLDNPKK